MEDQFPGNSRNHVNNPGTNPPPERDRPVLDKVITGKVVRPKKSLGRRFMETFFSGDSNSVLKYVVQDVIMPTAQELLLDVVRQGMEKAVYGEVRSANTRRVGGLQQRMNYNQMSNTRSSTNGALPARRASTQPSSLDVADVVLENLHQAQIIAEQLQEAIEQYGVVSVGNLYESTGDIPTAVDHKWGWFNLDDMSIKRVRGGYLIDLPPVEDIR